MTDRPQIGFIGAGRAGGALALGLWRAGYFITTIASRSPASARALAGQVGAAVVDVAATPDADLVFITTNDAAITEVCAQVARSGGWRAGQAAVHCSGALGREALAAAGAQGARTGVFHPLQTLPDVEQGLARLPGSYVGIEAGESLRGTLERMARDLGGWPLDLAGRDRARYHAAAAIVSNYTVTLFAVAVHLFESIGIAPEQARAALLPLLRGTVANLEQLALPAALTGPIARGDAPTLARHLQALAGSELLPLYRELAGATLALAAERGLDPAAIEAMRALLRQPD